MNSVYYAGLLGVHLVRHCWAIMLPLSVQYLKWLLLLWKFWTQHQSTAFKLFTERQKIETQRKLHRRTVGLDV